VLGGPLESGVADVRGDNEHVDAIEQHVNRTVAAQNNRDMRYNGYRVA